MEWDGGAKLTWQRSYACPLAVLDIGSWCNGSRRRGCLGRSPQDAADDVYYNDEDEELAPLEDYHAGGMSAWRWRALWRRMVRGKRRIFRSGVATPRVPYDPYTYAQNFEDQGSATWMEAENLNRSFSARFADPSRVLRSIG